MHDSKFKYSLCFARVSGRKSQIMAESPVDYIVALWSGHGLRAERPGCVAISHRTIRRHRCGRHCECRRPEPATLVLLIECGNSVWKFALPSRRSLVPNVTFCGQVKNFRLVSIAFVLGVSRAGSDERLMPPPANRPMPDTVVTPRNSRRFITDQLVKVQDKCHRMLYRKT